MYEVVFGFEDAQDNGYKYNVGDLFPRVGAAVSGARLAELTSANNSYNRVLVSLANTKKVDTPVEKEAEENPVEEAKPVEEEKKAYTEDELSSMTKNEIKALAEENGFKITSSTKASVVSEFLKQQNG